MKFNIAICDDNVKFVDRLHKYVSELMLKNDYECSVEEFYSGEELVKYCKRNLTDIIFVDIDMPGMDGFKATEELQKKQPNLAVVFVTAHREFAYQAYDYSPSRFVSKDDFTRLTSVVCTIAEKIKCRKDMQRYFYLKTDKNIFEIDIEETMYFKSKRNYIEAYRFNGEKGICLRSGIKDAYKKLKKANFIYIQRSYLVNCRFILDFDIKAVTLKNGKKLSVSRNTEMRKEAQQIYGKFMRDLRW